MKSIRMSRPSQVDSAAWRRWAMALVLLCPSTVHAQALVYPEKLPGTPAAEAPAQPAKPVAPEQKPLVPAISGTAAAATAADEEDTNGVQYAILQGTNKVTARSTRLESPIGTLVRFGNLEIVAQKCETTRPPARREQAALLDIWELKPSERPTQLFYGWMFASSPSLTSLPHAVYDVTVLECVRKTGEPQEVDAEPAEAKKTAPAPKNVQR